MFRLSRLRPRLGPGSAAEVGKLANAAFALLEHGLGDYASKPTA
jgi:hypothetical protein